MIAWLEGSVVSIQDDEVVINVGGIGYLVGIGQKDAEVLAVGQTATLHVYTYVREDQLTLYGFRDPNARTVFKKIITISGVGPKMAQAILSTYDVRTLREIALTENSAALKKIPGVGPKKAQRLALELKNALENLSLPPLPRSPALRASPANSIRADVLSALINLGFSEPRIRQVLDELSEEGEEIPFDRLLRRAISKLSG